MPVGVVVIKRSRSLREARRWAERRREWFRVTPGSIGDAVIAADAMGRGVRSPAGGLMA